MARVLSCLLAALSLATAAERMQLTILHTNDIHGHVAGWKGWDGELAGKNLGGFDRLATAVEQVRKESKHVLLLDAGDAIGDTLIAASTQGRAIVDLMNAVAYDAMTLGNHEPDFGMEVLQQRIADARFEVLAANVVESRTKKLFAKPYAIRTIGGQKIGILGIAYPKNPLTTAKKNVAGYDFRQAAETAAEYVPKIRAEGAGIVVVLSHLGLGADRRLASEVPGIDVIVGGHSHNRMTHPMHVGSTVIVQSGAHLSDLGRIDLEIDSGKVVASNGRLITLDHAAVASHTAVARRVREYESKAADEVIAAARKPIVRAQTLAGDEPGKRDAESPADSLFADIARERAGADAAFLPGVGYGVAIPAGPIGRRALKNLVPHESKLVAMTLTGADLRDIIEQSLENVLTDDPAKKVGGMIQVSGVVFAYDPRKPKGARLQQLDIAGYPVMDEQIYRLVTNTMLAEGGHNYVPFTRGAERKELGSQYETIEAALRRAGEVEPPAAGRISVTDERSRRR